MSEYGYVEGGIGRAFSNIAGDIRARSAENRAEKRKKKREDDIAALYQYVADPDISPTKKGATYGRLAAMGVTPPSEFIKPKKDMRPLMRILGLPQEIFPMFEDATMEDIITFKKAVHPEESLDDKVDDMVAAGYYTKEQGELMKSAAFAHKWIGAELTNKMFSSQFEAMKPEDPKEKDWERVMGEIDQGKTFEEFNAADRAVIVDNFKTDEQRNALFNKEGDAAKMFSMGMKAITDKAAFMFPLGVAPEIENWRQGRIDPVKQKAKSEFLNKYFNPITGEIKLDAAIAEGEEIFRSLQELEDRMNGPDDAETLQELLEIAPHEINGIGWDVIAKEFKSTSIDEIRKAYYEFWNARTGQK